MAQISCSSPSKFLTARQPRRLGLDARRLRRSSTCSAERRQRPARVPRKRQWPDLSGAAAAGRPAGAGARIHRSRHPPAAAAERRRPTRDDDYLRGPARQQFRRLPAGGLRPGRKAAVASRSPSCAEHAEPHPDHPPRLRRGLELHRQMDRHAAGADARPGRGQAAGALRRLPLLRHDGWRPVRRTMPTTRPST